MLSKFKPVLRASLTVMLLMSMLSIAMPTATFFPTVTPGNTHGLADVSGSEKLLQSTSGSHALEFSHNSVIIASKDHMLKIEFISARAVTPEADGEVLADDAGKTSPLSRVKYRDIWDGVTVVYEAIPGAIVKSTFYLDATEDGVPVELIHLGYNRPLSIDEQGNLVIAYETGKMVESAPVAWQEIDGQKKSVAVAFVLYGEREVSFSLGNYVPGVPVVIDPTVTWRIFLGGVGSDAGQSITVDGDGNVLYYWWQQRPLESLLGRSEAKPSRTR